jgi:hypothetical protein
MRTQLSSYSIVEAVVTIGVALLLTLAGYEMLAGVAADAAVAQATAATQRGA